MKITMLFLLCLLMLSFHRSPADQQLSVAPFTHGIVGQITDQLTGFAVPTFHITHARSDEIDTPKVTDFTPVHHAAGHYAIPVRNTSGYHWIRVDSKGYRSAQTAPQQFSDTITVITNNLSLEAVGVITNAVRGPDGRPMGGVFVMLIPRDVLVLPMQSDGRFERDLPYAIERSGPEGRVTFNQPDTSYYLIGTSDYGFGYLSESAAIGGEVLRIKPWASVEVDVTLDGEPQSNRLVNVQLDPAAKQDYPFTKIDMEQRTDAYGIARFNRVIPGKVRISVSTEPGATETVPTSFGHDRVVELYPGQEVTIRFELE